MHMPTLKRLIKTWGNKLRKILPSASVAVTEAATTVGATGVVIDLVGVVLHAITHGRSLVIHMHIHQEHFIGELSDLYLCKL
jgi:hypothetical protein